MPRMSKLHVTLKTGGYYDRIEQKESSIREIARELGVNHTSVSRAYREYKTGVDPRAKYREAANKAKRQQSRAKVHWTPQPPKLNSNTLPSVARHFFIFRERFFELAPGKPYTTPAHQQRWTKALLATYIGGGNQLVLSPPRHGKTELLAHLCVWLIVAVDPNIRILRIGGNEEIALDSVGMVRNELADNDALREAYLQAGETWQPHQRGGVWRESRFTVETRTLQRKSPTMVGIGRGGKLLSRDADIIIVDDIEEEDSVASETAREKTRLWWARAVMSRVEAHTSLFVIGSRQHHDDLYGHLIDDPEWAKIVERVHDEACTRGDGEWWKHRSCLLWWEVRDYRWVIAKKHDPLIAPIFNLVYQNNPDEGGTSTFSRELVDGNTLDPNRTRGHVPDPRHKLIAGLDPSATGYQSAVLYAFDPSTNRRYVVDIDNQVGGGIAKARQQIDAWLRKYGCRWWAVEENLYHGAIVKDEILKAFCQREGIHLERHETTAANKWSPVYGISTLAHWMEAGLYSIPWQTPEDQAHFHPLRQQFINFSDDTISNQRNKRTKTDLVMAAWFPERRMKAWRQEWLASNVDNERPASVYPFASFEPAYNRIAMSASWS